MNNYKFLAIIPARYASTRFPAKPLALLDNKPVIQHVFEKIVNCVDKTVVATDNQLIADVVNGFAGEVVMTDINHRSGTDRCKEALDIVGNGFDIVINVQGDEPFIHYSQIQTIKKCFDDDNVQIATLVKPFAPTDGFKTLENPNSPKVVVNANNEAILFSRSIIPFVRGVERGDEWLKHHTFFKHIGIYAYKADVLRQITSLPQSDLEITESLEQLRWIQNGYHIKVGYTDVETIGIDTPDDLRKAEEFIKKQKNYE